MTNSRSRIPEDEQPITTVVGGAPSRAWWEVCAAEVLRLEAIIERTRQAESMLKPSVERPQR